MKKKTSPVLAIVLLLVVLAIIGILTKLVRKYTPSSEVMSSTEYFGLYDESEAAVIVDSEILELKGKIQDEKCYVEYEVVKEYLNDCFYWDSDNNALIFTTPTDIVSIPVSETSCTVDGEKETFDHAIVQADAEKCYVSMEMVERYSGISYEMFHDPDRIVITTPTEEVTVASIRKNTKLRRLGGIKSPILREVSKNEVVTVLEDLDDWTGIMTQDGYRGYVRSDKLVDIHTEERTSDYTKPEYTSVAKDYSINLVWHQITTMDSNYSLIYDIADIKGVTTISPTWYRIADEDGTLDSLVLADYVDTAHSAEMEVWALIDNFSEEVDFTKVMNNTNARTKVENQLVASAIENGIDGINIDFENIAEDAADGYVQFMRELSVKCRKNGLVLSVDVPPPTFTGYYNRKALGEVCDYVIVMGYDEHYYGSETAGSVASLGYEEDGITETLKEVPAEKLISAIPFYTRLWNTVTNEDGSTEVTSEAMGMEEAEQTLKNNAVETQWDDSTSQNYASFEGSDGSLYEIWLEDKESLTEKLALLKKYELGGVAAWKLGFEKEYVWDLILKYID